MQQFMQFVVNHWILWAALVAILIAIFISEMNAQQALGKAVSPQGAVGMINHEHAVVIDIRNQDNYVDGHIIDSLNSTMKAFEDKKMNKYKEKPLILVCANGMQSSQFVSKLKQLGFSKVVALKGGINAWRADELPLVKGKK